MKTRVNITVQYSDSLCINRADTLTRVRQGGSHLDTGGVVVDHVEDVDEAQEDGDQESHPARHNLP